MCLLTRHEQNTIHNISSYLEIIDSYNDAEWLKHFRMTSSTFNLLLEEIHSLIARKFVGGYDPIPAREHLLISLEYLANNI